MDSDSHLLSEQHLEHVLENCDDIEHRSNKAAAVLENACLAFGTLEVLHRINLILRHGAVTAIVGPNGSGKTSLLKLLAGFTRPSAGNICWHDVEDVVFADQRGSYPEWMPLRVKDVISMGRYRRTGLIGRFREADKIAVAEAAAKMDLAHLMGLQLSKLSTGQRKRAQLAMCIAQEADMLLLDEPESGLDVASNQRIFDEMRQQATRGASVIFATHSAEEAAKSDHVIMLNKNVIAQGEPSDVLTEENWRLAFSIQTD